MWGTTLGEWADRGPVSGLGLSGHYSTLLLVRVAIPPSSSAAVARERHYKGSAEPTENNPQTRPDGDRVRTASGMDFCIDRAAAEIRGTKSLRSQIFHYHILKRNCSLQLSTGLHNVNIL